MYLLAGYLAFTAYVGFWYAIRNLSNTLSLTDKLFLIVITMITMPIAIPCGIVTGIFRMLTGVMIVLYVDEIEQISYSDTVGPRLGAPHAPRYRRD